VATGHEGISLGAHLRAGGETARDRSLEGGRLLAGSQEQNPTEEEAPHD